MILTGILDNQLDNVQTAKSTLPNITSLGPDIGKILFTLSIIKHEQLDFSLLVNGKSIERNVFSLIL